MNLENFHLLDNELIENSIIKEDLLKVYHQQGDIALISCENNNYHQIGNGFLEFDITLRKNDTTNFHYDDPIRLVKNAFAFFIKEARLSTTIGSEIEHNNYCGQVSAVLKVISKKMVIYHLNLIILTKMIYQFLRK